MSLRKRWLRWTVVALLLFAAADEGLSWSLAHGWLRSHLTNRLAAAFGRPVEVSAYDFSLLAGPRLEAHNVSVAEDPRFGEEYFLRADQLSVGLRWQPLLRGRIVFGTFSFTRPSLNLVRIPGGRWNLEDWLPPPAPAASTSSGNAASAGQAVARLATIEVNDGRINFKRGPDKDPTALVGVTGRIEQEGPGRWRIELRAQPARAAAIVQDMGSFQVSGLVGGTSARLRPANLQVEWPDASLPDALRLLRGYDYGVRGRLAVELTAHSEGEQWTFTATARARNLHRWDLPLRPGNPAVNLQLAGDWWPEQARLDISRALLEGPRSSVQASGALDWAAASGSSITASRGTHVQIVSAGVSFDDLLSWYRAFHPGVAERLRIEGLAGLDLQLTGWPLRIEAGAVATDGARVEGVGPDGAIRLGRAIMKIDAKSVVLSPTAVTLPKQAGTLRLSATLRPSDGWSFNLEVGGKVEQSQELLEAMNVFARPLPSSWNFEGPATFRLSWQGGLFPFAAAPQGTIDLRDAVWRAPSLNNPITLSKVRVELQPNQSRIVVGAAQAIGANWSGWLRRGDAAEPWQFDLTATRLDAANLDSWLRPQHTPTLLERILPGRQDAIPASAWAGAIRAQGRLQVKDFVLEPLELRRLRGKLDIHDRNFDLLEAQADFYGGTVHGSFRATMAGPPLYRAETQLERVNLSLLSAASPALRGRFEGIANGELELAARGVGRENLWNSLEGRGRIDLRNAQDLGLDWFASLAAGNPRPGTSAFASVSATFRLGDGKIDFEQLRLANPSGKLEATGSIDFSRVLALRVRALAPLTEAKLSLLPSPLLGQTFHLTGPLAAPQIARLASDARPR